MHTGTHSVAWGTEPLKADEVRAPHPFESHPDDPELGWLIGSAVVVNQGHAAYRRAIASRSEGYRIALCVALALPRLTAERRKPKPS